MSGKKKKPVSVLDPEIVWKALMEDVGFTAGMPESTRPVFRKLVDALPGVVKEHLDKKVTLVSLAEAKLAITEHCLDSGFATALFAAMPTALFPFPVEEIVGEAIDGLKRSRMPLMEMIHNTAAFLSLRGMSERVCLATPNGPGLDAKSLAAYDKGTLTIRSLLETQPAVLLINGQS